jgi:hypothetical protein
MVRSIVPPCALLSALEQPADAVKIVPLALDQSALDNESYNLAIDADNGEPFPASRLL